MSNGFGRYHFLAWSRQGIAATLANPDSGGSLPARGALQVGLTVSAQGPTPSSQLIAPVSVQTYGPGDVLGIDPRHVVRTEPPSFTTNFESNYLAAIEFDQPDFPWLFTPAAPAGDRIRPWLVLIALKTTEYSVVPGVPQPLAAIDVNTLAALQSLADSWNWAHTQVSGDGGLAGTLATAPASVISRLICPRRLDPETSYAAFVVPAFEIGRQAGLGMDISSLTTSDPAWTSTTPVPLRLPVYYQFQFHTSDQGDFESLVRRLVPTKLGGNVGQRPMQVDAAAADFPSAGTPLGLEGALQSLTVAATPWNDPAKTAFQTALAALVNRTSPVVDDPTKPDPQLVPPLYGCWPAGVFSVSPTGTGWLAGLNLDPRNRTESGMGTQVVQANLTALLASAWQQVAGIEAANALLRRAQLARGVLTMLHTQRFSIAAGATLLSLTAPVHNRLLAGSQTVSASIAATRVPPRMLSATFRRLTSPAGPIRRRQTQRGATIGSLVERLNSSAIAIVPAPAPPGGLVPIEDIAAQATTSTAQTTAGSVQPAIGINRGHGPVRLKALTPQAVAAVPPRPGFVITRPGAPVSTTGGGTADSIEATLFRTALSSFTTALQAPSPDPPLPPAADLATLSGGVLTALDPAATVPARIASLVNIAAHVNWHPVDPIRTIMAAPSFPRPMYAPLRDLSTQYILPGADQVPADSVSLLQANHAFIEAYMVGLNHEMARQLLWAGYPTDCMGTYFRQFWDVSNYVPQPGDPTDPAQMSEMLKDIPPINTWPLAGPLGTHDNRTNIAANNVVLLIRGELLRRYPDAIIYAAKAQISGNQRIIDPTDERYPIYRGTLGNDITFVGFNLSPQDAKGGTAAAPQGFFFVFQQHPTGPRFGLEPSATGSVTQWSDLAWTNFATGSSSGSAAVQPQPSSPAGATANAVPAPNFVAPWAAWRLPSLVFQGVLASTVVPNFLSASLSPSGTAISGSDDAANVWGADAAQTAYITLRLPFRIAIHADLMVPS
jgi:hypothetical protein